MTIAAGGGATVLGPKSPLGRRVTHGSGHGSLGRRIARGSGEALITAGLIVLLFAIYEVYGRASEVNAHQGQLSRQLDRLWAQTPSSGGGIATVAAEAPRSGDAIARLYIPVLRLHWVVVEGVAPNDIEYAPGHYPGTAMPGEVGNFAVAGHRIPPLFWNLQDVHPRDEIVVETATEWYVYRVTVNEIVSPHAIRVIAPVPDQPGALANVPSLTLTTCNPKWNDYQRMVVHAVLITSVPRSAGPPVSLGS